MGSIEGSKLWSPEDSCQKVRRSCKQWMEEPEHEKLVKIESACIEGLAVEIYAQQKSASIEWDEEKWHYIPSSKITKAIALERLALYIVALDTINFCFWPGHQYPERDGVNNLEYEHLAIAMARMAQEDEKDQEEDPTGLTDSYIFSPSRLATISVDEMRALLDKHLYAGSPDEKKYLTPLEDIEKRCTLWNELGRVLQHDWNGNIRKFLQMDGEKADTSAPQLVDRIVSSFPGFRDCYPWNHEYLYLYKRAQICVGDLNAALKLQLEDMDKLTTFADYRVPQLLRHVGVLQYGATLSDAIDAFEEIEHGSLEEKTIRAATVVAVDNLVGELNKQQTISGSEVNKTFTAVGVDWYLWQLGERMHNAGTLKPHHRTRTIFY